VKREERADRKEEERETVVKNERKRVLHPMHPPNPDRSNRPAYEPEPVQRDPNPVASCWPISPFVYFLHIHTCSCTPPYILFYFLSCIL